jgi:hypothetical protein
MKPRIYIDTSVIGGCLDVEFSVSSQALMQAFVKAKSKAIISDLMVLELENAPLEVRKILDEIPDENRENVLLTAAAADLANEYITAGAIGPGMKADAQHIAIASVERVDLLVSWNFKHIVNIRRIHAYNSVNLRLGYPVLEIRSPLEVLLDENDG